MKTEFLHKFHLIEVQYMNGRVRLYSHQYREAKYIKFESNLDSIDTAKKYLLEKGFELTGIADTKTGCVYISSTFQSIK